MAVFFYFSIILKQQSDKGLVNEATKTGTLNMYTLTLFSKKKIALKQAIKK